MNQIDEIFRHIENGNATEEEMRMAEAYFHDLDQRLSSRIDEWEAETSSPKKPRKLWFRHIAAAAACLLLIVSVALWFDRSTDTPSLTSTVQKDTFDNPEDAAKETEMALLKFSEAINKATCYNTN